MVERRMPDNSGRKRKSQKKVVNFYKPEKNAAIQKGAKKVIRYTKETWLKSEISDIATQNKHRYTKLFYKITNAQ